MDLKVLQLTMVFFNVVVCNDLTNIAIGKSVYQSTSEYTDAGGADLAVDGNTNQYWGGDSCSHTRNEEGSYWEVDLGGIYVIDSVEIYNRMDGCCNDKLVGVEILGGMNTDNYQRIGYNVGTILTSYKFQMDQTVYARLIRVTRNPDIKQPLMLCEVEVMGYKPTSVTFIRVSDALATGSSLATGFSRSWQQCCHKCFTTVGCAAAVLKDSLCSLLDSDSYVTSTGDTIYKLM